VTTTSCPACGQRSGSNASCLSCREAAARELARGAADVTPAAVVGTVGRVGRFLDRRPWWARSAPADLLARVRLLWMVLRDTVKGEYQLPWKAIAALVAAALYVLSPFDLIPDFLGLIGFTDDALVVALTWGLLKSELLEYCEWKGLAPGHFGIEARR